MTCICGKPTRDEAFVCEPCLDELTKVLNEIPWLTDELEITITRQRGIPTEGGSASAETSLPFHEKASLARRALRNTLTGWVRICSEEGVRNSDPHGERLPVDNLPSMARWLLWRVDGLAFHEAGDQAVSEIVKAFGECRRYIDRPAERQYVGPCHCGRDLYRKPGAPVVKCKACENEYDADALRDYLQAQVGDRLVTASEGAGLLSRYGLPTNARIIYGWEERGRIVAHTQQRPKTYRFDDLMRMAASVVKPTDTPA